MHASTLYIQTEQENKFGAKIRDKPTYHFDKSIKRTKKTEGFVEILDEFA